MTFKTPSTTEWQKIIAELGETPSDATPSPPSDLPDFALEDVPELDEGDLQPYLSPRSTYVSNLSIVDVYNRYAGKGEVPHDQRGTNVVVRCPTPQHNDENPSACLEIERNVWVCYGCDASGGTYEIAAYHYGYNVPEYRHTPQFSEVVGHMADDFGYTPGDENREVVYLDTPEPEPAPVVPIIPAAPRLTLVKNEDNEDEEEEQPPTIFDDRDPFPWWEVYDESGFRYQYMLDTTSERILPHEFLAAGADTALGMAIGHNLYLQTEYRTYANVYSVLIGHTGAGKSLATVPLLQLLEDVLPYSVVQQDGVKHLPQVGSGEALIAQMNQEGIDENTGQPAILPLKGFLYVDELANFVSRMNRKGSTLQPILTEMYGAVDRPMATFSLTTRKIECVNPFLSFMTGVQPYAMQSLMGEIDLVNGFLNRFMVYVGTDIDIPSTYDATKYHPYHLDASRNLLWGIKEFAEYNRDAILPWSSAATKRYNDLFVELRRTIGTKDENPELARLNMHLSKLILQCVVDVESTSIELEHVQRAEKHLEYFTQGLIHIAANVGNTIVDEAAKKIMEGMLRWQSRGKEWMTRKEVRDLVRKSKFIDVFDKTLIWLDEIDVIESQKVIHQGAGRPTVRYRLKV